MFLIQMLLTALRTFPRLLPKNLDSNAALVCILQCIQAHSVSLKGPAAKKGNILDLLFDYYLHLEVRKYSQFSYYAVGFNNFSY
jgi:hypothetical protein